MSSETPRSGLANRLVGTPFAVLSSLTYQVLLMALIIGGAYAFAPPSRFVAYLNHMVMMWDTRHFLTIAREGYAASGPQAPLIVYFPLYPFLISLLTPAFGDLRAALLITAASSMVGHILLFHYLRLIGFDPSRSLRVIALVFATPVSIYFAAAYTEGLFFLLTMAFVVLLRREAWLPAALCGFLAALTRNMGGLFVIPYLAACWSVGPASTRWRRASLAGLIASGTLVYFGINYAVQGDPFAFSRHMADTWYKALLNPFAMYRAEFMGIVTGQFRPEPYYALLYLDRIATLLFPLLFVDHLLSLRRTQDLRPPLPPGFFLWAVAQYLVVCSQSFWASNLRYLGLILPGYLLLERALEPRVAFRLWLVLSIGLGLWVAYAYTRMLWVL